MKSVFSGNELDLDNEFNLRLSHCSELELVMLIAIAIEHELNQFIDLILPSKKFLNDIRLDFNSKGKLALSLGLSEEFKAPLTFLGGIRNDFAHVWETKLRSSDVDNFVSSFKKDHLSLVKTIHSELAATSTSETFSQEYTELEPKDRFLLSAVVLRMGIRASRIYVGKLEPAVQDFLANNPTLGS